MRVLALQLVELAVVPGGGASERGHILYQDHPSPEHVEIHRVSLQRGGLKVVEGLGDERHLGSLCFHTGCRRGLGVRLYLAARSPDSPGAESCLFMGVKCLCRKLIHTRHTIPITSFGWMDGWK